MTWVPSIASKLRLVLTTPPDATAEVNEPFGCVVTAYGPDGAVAVGFDGDVVVDADGGTTTIAAVAGVATFTDLEIATLGARTLTFRADGWFDLSLRRQRPASCAATVTTFGTLAFVGGPSDQKVNTVLASFDVELQDFNGDPIASYTGTITLAIHSGPGSATLGGTLAKAAVAGVATFGDVQVNKTGDYELEASASGYTTEISASWHAGADRLSITTQPAIVALGTVVALTVSLVDGFGTVDTAATDHVTLTPSSGSWGGTLDMDAAAGVAAFTDPTLPSAFTGDVTFAASASGLTGATSVSVLVPNKVYRSSVSAFTIVAGVGQWTVGGAGTAAGETLTINGTVLTCVASGAGADQWNASASASTSATNIKNCINASAGLSGVVTASNSGAVLTVTRAVSTDDSGIAVSYTTNLTKVPSSSVGGTYNNTNILQGVSNLNDARGSAWGAAAQATAALRPGSAPSYLNSLRALALTTSSLQLADTTGTIPTQAPYTLVVRIKSVDATAAHYAFVSLDANATQNNYRGVGITTAGKALASSATSSGSQVDSGAASSASANDGTWRVLVAQQISSTSRKISIDGGTVASSSTSKVVSDATAFVLGGSKAKAGANGPLLGYMLDAILVGRDVTAAEIALLVSTLAGDV